MSEPTYLRIIRGFLSQDLVVMSEIRSHLLGFTNAKTVSLGEKAAKSFGARTIRQVSLIEALASFLMHGTSPSNYSFTDLVLPSTSKMVNCTKAEWELILNACRLETFNLDISLISQEELSKYARVGRWPEGINHAGVMGYQDFDALNAACAWAWVWSQDRASYVALINGTPPTDPNSAVKYALALGLILALQHQLIAYPEDHLVAKFVKTYASWIGKAEGFGCSIDDFCTKALSLKVSTLNSTRLRELSNYWPAAANELRLRN